MDEFKRNVSSRGSGADDAATHGCAHDRRLCAEHTQSNPACKRTVKCERMPIYYLENGR